MKLIRKQEVCDLTTLTERGIDARVKAGTFPQPVFLDTRQTRWVEQEVLDWVAARIANRAIDAKSEARRALQVARGMKSTVKEVA